MFAFNSTNLTSSTTWLPNETFSTNVTNSTTSDWPYLPLQPKQGLILFLIALPGTLANIVAFLATIKLAKKQRTISAANYLVLALTITDFYGIVFCTMPTLLCYLKKGWVGGMPMCNFQGVSTMFSSLASGSLATSMAIERLFAVWKPFAYRKTATVRKTLFIVVIIWSAAFVIGVIPLSRSGNFVRNLTGTFCTINWFARNKDNIAYAIFYVILGVSLLIVIVFSNVKLAICLIGTGKKRKLLTQSSQRKLLKENSEIADKKTSESNNMEKQLAKTVGLISLLFIICWAPFMIRIICNLTGVWVDAWVDVQVSRLLLLNFVLDPFLYTLSRKQCRDIVKGWLCCCCVKQRGGKASLLARLFSIKRKKHGSFLSSGQTGSGSTLHTGTVSSVPMTRLKSGSSSATPTQSKENSIADVVIHSSGNADSSSVLAEEQVKEINTDKGAELDQIVPIVDESGINETVTKRHHSASAMDSKFPSKEKTQSVPDLTEIGEDDKNNEIKVDVAYMYDLAFKRQNSDSEIN